MTRPRTGFPFLDAGLDQPGAVLAFAHRGGAFHPDLEGLENTLTAFEHAVELGYRYLETDVHATRDGVLLAFHDAALDRVTSHTGSIADTGYDELAEVVVGERERIPTLASLLERFPDTCFNIDIKAERAVEPLADLVRRTRAHDRVCVLELELEGALRVQEETAAACTIFIAADVAELERRLRERATESTGEIDDRITLARFQLEQAHKFRYMVRNDDVVRATEVLSAIVERELVLAGTMLRR